MTCPADAALVLVDPPFPLGKAGKKERKVGFDVCVNATASWTLIVAPLPTMREWLPQVSPPTRILWWRKTFAVPDWIVCCNALADSRHLVGVKHPGITGAPIATELILPPPTRAGDLVVDPMCGCGSILVAAHRLGRRVGESEYEYAATVRGGQKATDNGDVTA